MFWSLCVRFAVHGSGFLCSSLLLDVFLFLVVCLLTYKIAIPVFRSYWIAKELDRLCGTVQKHWLYGHVKEYGSNEQGLLNKARLSATFPSMQNLWVGPIHSFVFSYHPDTNISMLGNGVPKDTFAYKFLKPWLGDGLLLSSGRKWQRNRRLLTPVFHYKILQQYLTVFNACSGTLVEKFKKHLGSSVDVSKAVSLMTLDTMMQCAMSSKTNCQNCKGEHPYVEGVNELSSLLLKRVYKPMYWIDWIFNLTSDGKRFNRTTKTLHSFAEKLIEERREAMQRDMYDKEEYNESKPSEKKLLDFLDILLQTKDENGEGLTDKEIRDEVDTFLFGGHDTTASAISWAMFNMANHPDLQEKCRREVTSIIEMNKNIEWEDLPKLTYLTMFIKESMRLYSTVPAVGRELSKPLQLSHSEKPDKVLPAGSILSIHIFAQHRNPHVWNNAMHFDPERFTKENISKRSPHAYIPFSAGSRNCIGQNFAMNEIKVVLAQIVRRFKLYLDEETPKPIMSSEIVLRSVNGIHVKFASVEESCL